jgi:hypothetical protein
MKKSEVATKLRAMIAGGKFNTLDITEAEIDALEFAAVVLEAQQSPDLVSVSASTMPNECETLKAAILIGHDAPLFSAPKSRTWSVPTWEHVIPIDDNNVAYLTIDDKALKALQAGSLDSSRLEL